jgi:beta-glucosidase
MTDDERFSLIVSLMGPVPSIGVPALQSSDASMGDTNPGYRPDDKGAAAFPASIVVGSSFDLSHARDGGAAIGREARLRGFNVMLAGGINLARDVRNGRNFEYWPKRRWLPACLASDLRSPCFVWQRLPLLAKLAVI